jgi:hypothetical protein
MQPSEPFYVDDAVRALLDPRVPATDPVIQTIQVAMSGFGYNFHDARNVARSNDQIVRERASDVLGELSIALGKLERSYRDLRFPGATREVPMPPPDVLHRIREIDSARKRAEALATALHTAETPATDMIWIRFRNEMTTLQRLVALDVGLALGTVRARDTVLSLVASALDDSSLSALDGEFAALEKIFNQRSALLKGG